jgi:transcriptional antiterminator RfaH
MPLLQLERFVYPDDLLTASAPPAEGAAAWWVLHTRPRAEKSLARKMAQQEVPFFLPLYRQQWRNRGRLFASHLPLFPGYVFLHGDHEARLKALETNLIANVLPVTDQHQLHSELVNIHHLIVSGLPLTPEAGLVQGAVVEITSGLLSGLKGKVLRRGKGLRLFVEVTFFQRGVSVEIESWMVRLVRDQN